MNRKIITKSILLFWFVCLSLIVFGQNNQVSTEPNDLPVTSNVVVPNFINDTAACRITGKLDSRSDIDYYRIYLPEDYSYTLKVNVTSLTSGAYSYYTYFSEDQKSDYSYMGPIQINSLADRTFYFKLNGYNDPDYLFEITVIRSITPIISTNISYLNNLSADGDDIRIKISSNSAWDITLPEGFTASPNEGTGTDSVTIHVGKNESVESRTGKIIVNGVSNYCTIYYSQQGVTFNDPNEPNNTLETATSLVLPAFTNDTSRVTMPLASFSDKSDFDFYKLILEEGYNYRLTLIDHLSEINDWNLVNNGIAYIDVYNNEGNLINESGSRFLSKGGNTLFYQAKPYILGNYNYDIFIKRYDGGFLEANAERTKFTYKGSSYYAGIEANSSVDWKAKASNDWIQLYDTAGVSGCSTLSFKVLANATTNARSGNIIFTAAGVTPVVVSISQDGTGDVLPDSYESNNSAKEAFSIPFSLLNNGSTYTIDATIDSKNDVDFYKITLPSDINLYRISSDLIANNGSYNSESYLLYAYQFYGKDTSFTNSDKVGSATLKGGETYYMKIENNPFSLPDTGNYQLNCKVEKIDSPYFTTSAASSYQVGWKGDTIISIVVNTNVSFMVECFNKLENTVIYPNYSKYETSQVVEVSVYKNHSTEIRKDTIYFYPEGMMPIKIPVVQAAGVVTNFSLPDTAIYLNYIQPKIAVDILSNTSISTFEGISWANNYSTVFGNSRL